VAYSSFVFGELSHYGGFAGAAVCKRPKRFQCRRGKGIPVVAICLH
jgi:hypothetical protein